VCHRRWKGELSFRSVESIVGVGFYDSGWGLQVESRLLVIFLRKALADHSFSLLSTSTLTQGRNKLTVTRLLHDFQEPAGPTVFVGNYFQQFYVSQNSSSCSKKIMGLSFFFWNYLSHGKYSSVMGEGKMILWFGLRHCTGRLCHLFWQVLCIS